MARQYPGSANNKHAKTGQIAAGPLTLFCVFNPDAIGANEGLLSLGTASGTNYAYLVLRTDGTVQMTARGNVVGDTALARSSNSISAGSWSRACGTTNADASNVSITLNGTTTDDSDATPATAPSGMNELRLGNAPADAFNQDFDGGLGEAAAWDVELTQAEREALTSGKLSPLFIRPQNLVHYVPLKRSIYDTRDAGAFSGVGTTTVVDHPQVIHRPTRMQGFAVAAGGVTVPIFRQHYENMARR